jgi:hypothetical protein
MYQYPGPEEFKAYFDRNQFAYGDEYPAVRDKDISAAMGEARAMFNPDLYPDQETFSLAFLYLAAHFLACDIDAAESGGLGGAGFAQTSRSADGISESIAVPDWVTQDPGLSLLIGTYFGRKYITIALRYSDGVVFVVGGATLP